MTREEAIKELELIAKVTMWNDRREAVDMAIEALQAEPTHGRLIDAEALVRSIRLDISITGKKNAETVVNVLNEIMAKIADAPTVQADRPYGEWIADTKDMALKCSLCGEQFKFDDIDEMIDYKEYAYFCIHCGAKMTKGGDDE